MILSIRKKMKFCSLRKKKSTFRVTTGSVWKKKITQTPVFDDGHAKSRHI